MRGPPASSSPTTRSDTLLPTLPTRIKSGSTENDIDRHQQEQNEGEDHDDSILSNPFDDSDFELDEMENLKLKKGALDKFRLPIDVIEGSVGSLLLSLIIRFYHYSRWPALGSKFDLEEDEKRKQASKMEIRRSNGEAWLRDQLQGVVSNSTCQSGLELPEPIRSIELDREIFECEALPRIWLLHPDNSISHEDSNGLNLLMIEGLTKEERTQAKGLVRIGGFDPTCSSSGRPRPACLPDPTKKRRNSRTINQELKLPKNESSSSGLDDQQTENATEETTLIPQIKKGKEREKDQRINEELEQRNSHNDF
ncbi:hypothetical protein PPACK8108_LOCUS7437 [Phakopsora pachyrhizi]|uniref:Uncharacterized protein n=1 Tax=Phakopsora pachyrhizi TaxID=170000 RepID=A0AAV0AWD6_PHAPC|nr:hypothetical protein PPACK8108_LOCUS7437 [Phakopsora pachyrhizi]